MCSVPTDTLVSIFVQEIQSKVIRSNHWHWQRMVEYCEAYLAGEDILAVAATADFPPCMLLRRMLESMLRVPKQVGGKLRHRGEGGGVLEDVNGGRGGGEGHWPALAARGKKGGVGEAGWGQGVERGGGGG